MWQLNFKYDISIIAEKIQLCLMKENGFHLAVPYERIYLSSRCDALTHAIDFQNNATQYERCPTQKLGNKTKTMAKVERWPYFGLTTKTNISRKMY